MILDFFAGSGTTGHADGAGQRRGRRDPAVPVGQLRRADPAGLERRSAGYATVADITRARLRAVAERVGGGFAVGDPEDLGAAFPR